MPTNPPKGWPRISVALFYDDAAGALEWLQKAFGFSERVVIKGPDGSIAHSELEFDGGVVMVAGVSKKMGWDSPRNLEGKNTQGISMYVDDVDAHCERARAAGAEIVEEPTTRDYGDRGYQARDCEGHLWWFGQRLDDEAWDRATKEHSA